MSDSRPVRVITDSTSDLPPSVRQALGIDVVPLTVTFGTTSYADGVDITPTEFLAKLRSSSNLPTTSQPSMPTFGAAFQSAIDDGCDVVCITISSELSGTFNSARLAAEDIGSERITVIDSRTTTMQLGWIAVAAARAAGSGANAIEVAAAAEHAISHSSLFAVLQTLDYVYKGGRIGRAQHLFGSALAIKPIITLRDGVVEPFERVRTWKKAVGRLVDLVEPTPTDIMVLHSDNLGDAEQMATTLQTRYPTAKVDIGLAGAIIMTYAGPGAVAVTALYA